MTPGGPGHLHTSLGPAPPPGPGPASRGGAPLAQAGAVGRRGGGRRGLVRARPRFPGRCIRRRDAGSRGTASRGPLLIYPPGSFHGSAAILRPFLEQNPAAGAGPARRGPRGRAQLGAPGLPGGGRASFPSPGARGEAHPQSYFPGSCTTSAVPALPPHPCPPPARTPDLFPTGPGDGAPRAQRSPRPGGAGEGRGAGKVAELLCTLRSCS